MGKHDIEEQAAEADGYCPGTGLSTFILNPDMQLTDLISELKDCLTFGTKN